ncbi:MULTISPECIES: helix-turn-helix domain-containing protein [unclassified Nocardiopsis]|uniref:transposase n=1 Tax=unclassified Nocardiopsis TaxID=2649073 RepID=UPI002107E167|nr:MULTISPECIES: helix-turn-helix domain-containing protein [unclassified Nocardiopsis]
MYSSHIRRSAVSMIDSGISYAEVSRRMGINRSTLRAWAQDRSLIDKYRDSGECPRCRPLPRPPRPPRSTATSWASYLGDGSISPAGNRDKGVWRLRIFCGDS